MIYSPLDEGSKTRCGRCLADRERARNAAPKRRAYSSPLYQEAKARLKGWPCYVEGCTTPSDTVDHIIPLRMGGTNAPFNLRPACRRHNSAWRTTTDGH